MYTDEQLEKIADEAARILEKGGHIVERRSGGPPVRIYAKPDAALIKAVLRAETRILLYGTPGHSRDHVLDPPPKYGYDFIVDVDYEQTPEADS